MNSATISYNNLQAEDDSIRPDTTIVITEDGTSGPNVHHFYAHHYVLANYSGYFKTLLSHNASTNVINISTIRPTTFAALLNYMYTGSLDLNYVNVYEIFLASNLLHIPSILERCKTYLSHNQPSSTAGGNGISAGAITSSRPIVIKPIPMKTTYPIVFTPPPRTDRIQFEASIFKPLVTKLKADFSENRQRISGLQLTLTNNGSKESDGNSDTSPDTNSRKGSTKMKMKTTSVIIDVASCDGPIKFSKVLNTNYKPTEIGAGTDARQPFVSDHSSNTQSATTSTNDILAPSLNDKQQIERNSPSVASHLVSGSSGKRKTEDKHLQYYPCKLCGSKFPSYYFVHKHRKSHHFDRHERKK